jgi:hypothetical protein
MSRLGTRVRRLEEHLGPCGLCGRRPVRIEIVTPSRRYFPGDGEPGPCPACGKQPEIISLRLNYETPPPRPGERGERSP